MAMLSLICLSTLLSALALAAPLNDRPSVPSVTIKNGTIVGSSSQGVDSFKGIPYAQPPVGNLRLRPPQSIVQGFGTIQATAQPRACPQTTLTQVNTDNLPIDVVGELMDSPLFQAVTNSGEDCLTVNVQRPSTANSTSKLPVLFWIYGGGFEGGSTSLYDGSSIVRRSISLNEPIIYVSVNYRVSGFGFLGGKELADEHSTNLGLRDQRLGLQWAAENVEAFGGDPDRVTIWGESAGSFSVYDHTIINGGDNTYNGKPLFHGAIMSSGSIVPATDVTTPVPQAIFDTVVEACNCSVAIDKLACLRSTDYTTFLNAVNSVPPITSYRSLDFSYLPRGDLGDDFFPSSPEIPLLAGQITKVPIIIGDQEDEGPLFSILQLNITNNDELIDYLTTYFPSNPNAREYVEGLVANYPDEPLIGQPDGSPFRTGSLNNIYPEFKRLAAVLGDLTFTLVRRVYIHALQSLNNNDDQPIYSYLSTYLHALPVLGTFHGSDIVFSFGLLSDDNPITKSIQTYFVNFVNHLDPNGKSSGNASMVEWPAWSDEGAQTPQMLEFGVLEDRVIDDDFREAAYTYLLENLEEFRL